MDAAKRFVMDLPFNFKYDVSSFMEDPLERILSTSRYVGRQALTTASDLTPDDVYNSLRWFLLEVPLVPILLIFHTTFAALKVYEMTPPRTFWLKSLVLTASVAFGGSTMAAVLSSRPPPLFTTASNVMLSYIVVAWYVVHQVKPLRMLLTFRPILACLAFGATAGRMRAIFNFMDDFVRAFPRAAAGAVVLGALAGSGGRFFISLENMVQKGRHNPSEFSAPGWALKSSFFAATAYYVLVDPNDVLYDMGFALFEFNSSDARFYISVALCFHAALETLYGAHVNPFFVSESIFYAFTGLRHGVKVNVDTTDPDSTAVADSTGQVLGTASSGSPVSEKPAQRLTGTGLRRRKRR